MSGGAVVDCGPTDYGKPQEIKLWRGCVRGGLSLWLGQTWSNMARYLLPTLSMSDTGP